MPDPTRFETVPISEVPSPMTSININGLEAFIADDEEITGGSLNILNPKAVRYEVRGLPHGHKAWIRQDPSGYRLVLEVLGEAEFLGEYPILQDALQALSNKLTRLPPTRVIRAASSPSP